MPGCLSEISFVTSSGLEGGWLLIPTRARAFWTPWPTRGVSVLCEGGWGVVDLLGVGRSSEFGLLDAPGGLVGYLLTQGRVVFFFGEEPKVSS